MLEALAAAAVTVVGVGTNVRLRKAQKKRERCERGEFKDYTEWELWLRKPLKRATAAEQVAYVLSLPDANQQGIAINSVAIREEVLEELTRTGCQRMRDAFQENADVMEEEFMTTFPLLVGPANHSRRTQVVEDLLVDLVTQWPGNSWCSSLVVNLATGYKPNRARYVRLSAQNQERVLRAHPGFLIFFAWSEDFAWPTNVPLSTYRDVSMGYSKAIDLAGGFPPGDYQPWLKAFKAYEGTLQEFIDLQPTLR